jgi:hypothetical protein
MSQAERSSIMTKRRGPYINLKGPYTKGPYRIVEAAAPDTTPPIISDLAYDDPDFSFDVNELGTLWYLVNDAATPLAGTAIKAAVIATTPEVYGTEAVSPGGGVITFDDTGLAAGTWYMHVSAEDTSANMMEFGEVASFVIAASETTATIAATGGGENGNLTSHPVTLPSGSAGELIVVAITTNSFVTFVVDTGVSGSDWTVESFSNGSGGDHARLFLVYKVAAGSDALTMTAGASCRSIYQVYRYTPGDGAFDIQFSSATTSSAPAALALDMTTSAEYLWGSAIVNYNDVDAAHTVPADFGTINTRVHAVNPTIMDRRLSSAHRTHTTDELTGVTWTYGGTTRWAAALWAVGPA